MDKDAKNLLHLSYTQTVIFAFIAVVVIVLPFISKNAGPSKADQEVVINGPEGPFAAVKNSQDGTVGPGTAIATIKPGDTFVFIDEVKATAGLAICQHYQLLHVDDTKNIRETQNCGANNKGLKVLSFTVPEDVPLGAYEFRISVSYTIKDKEIRKDLPPMTLTVAVSP